MEKPKISVSVLFASLILIVIVVAIVSFINGGHRNTKSEAENVSEAIPAFLRSELQKAEKGDYVRYEGMWYLVVENRFKGDDGYIVAAISPRCGNSFSIYLNAESASITDVIRWKEGDTGDPEMTPVGHLKWIALARQLATP